MSGTEIKQLEAANVGVLGISVPWRSYQRQDEVIARNAAL